MRAAMPCGPKHPDRFAGRPLQTFFYDVCDRLAARDAVRIFQLRIGEIVASRVGFVAHDSVYLYYSGFDPSWGVTA
jgi:CelD/BcsL family acetyltransferase involved in cellulose biosynthesis